jgi:hypothetical protein
MKPKESEKKIKTNEGNDGKEKWKKKRGRKIPEEFGKHAIAEGAKAEI